MPTLFHTGTGIGLHDPLGHGCLHGDPGTRGEGIAAQMREQDPLEVIPIFGGGQALSGLPAAFCSAILARNAFPEKVTSLRNIPMSLDSRAFMPLACNASARAR